MREDEKACPACAETIKAAAVLCRYCFTDLRTFNPAGAATVADEAEEVIFSGHPAVIYSIWQVFGVVFTFGLAYLIYKGKSLATRYEITTQRIKVEHGLAVKVRDNFELYSIEHFEVWSTWGMRQAGYGVLVLRSADVYSQSIAVYGVPGIEELADKLRECSFRERSRRRITSIIRP